MRTSQDVIFAEKVREDELRDNGWQVVRWLWSDLYRPGVLRDRLLPRVQTGPSTGSLDHSAPLDPDSAQLCDWCEVRE